MIRTLTYFVAVYILGVMVMLAISTKNGALWRYPRLIIPALGWPMGIMANLIGLIAFQILHAGAEKGYFSKDAVENYLLRVLNGAEVEHASYDCPADCAEHLIEMFALRYGFRPEAKLLPPTPYGTVRLSWHQRGVDLRPWVNGFVIGWLQRDSVESQEPPPVAAP